VNGKVVSVLTVNPIRRYLVLIVVEGYYNKFEWERDGGKNKMK
jgi:hypothetical protein